jgi:branched-chain amino acid transport system permease protein
LIFGVIDVVWICYAELVMIGMYGLYYLYSVYGVPMWIAAPACIALVALLGLLLHFIVIQPLLDAGTDQPAARHRRSPVSSFRVSPPWRFGSIFATSASACRCWRSERCISALRAYSPSWRRWPAWSSLYLFMTYTYMGHRDPRDLPGSPDHGVDGCRHETPLSRDLGAGWRAGRLGGVPSGAASTMSIPSSVCLSDHHLSDRRVGRTGNFIGGFVAAFIFAEIISLGGLYVRPRVGLCAGVRVLYLDDVCAPAGPVGEALETGRRCSWHYSRRC